MMDKVRLDPEILPPMPVTLVGAMMDGRPNFMAAAWVTRLGHKPPLVGVSVNHRQLTGQGIRETGTFSLCLPGPELVAKVDYCGLVSGRTVDKAALFDVFYGELETAPMVRDCPLCLEIRLERIVELPSNSFFIGEIVAGWADGEILTDGAPDVAKYRPLLLTMPDNRYWTLGECAGKAWSAGKTLKKEITS
jgi:flavin reductase (DIM6/NTAB) family NADH-FMN oxidoreductase RutF